MGDIRKVFEEKVLGWTGVSSKEMMGCLTYFCGTKFFALLVTNGVVITKLPQEAQARLPKGLKVEPFQMAGRTVKTWIRVALTKPEDVAPILPFVQESYRSAKIAGE